MKSTDYHWQPKYFNLWLCLYHFSKLIHKLNLRVKEIHSISLLYKYLFFLNQLSKNMCFFENLLFNNMCMEGIGGGHKSFLLST